MKGFEESIAWQKSKTLNMDIYEEFNGLYEKVEEISKILAGLIKKL